MLEATVFRDWCYGTSLDSLNLDGINVGVFNVDGIDILYDNPHIDLYVVLVEAPAKVRLIRSLNREENPDVDEIIRRYLADEKDFEHFYGENCIVLNDRNSQLDMKLAAGRVIEEARHFWAEKTN